MKTDKEIYIDRMKRNKKYSAYIEREIADKFDKKLKNNELTFTNWLKKNIERYLQNF